MERKANFLFLCFQGMQEHISTIREVWKRWINGNALLLLCSLAATATR
jgi:hypothetical protein